MLVLSRKVGESICIDDNIEVTILSIRGNQVKLGTKAPKTVSVNRNEIQQRIQEVQPIRLKPADKRQG